MKKKTSKKLDKNTRTLILLAACVAFMASLTYASVPLYSIFCRATGLGGTTQRVTSAPSEPLAAKERFVTVNFDGNVDPGLPWDFAPEARSVRLKLGETTIIKYRARNNSTKPLTGIATFNVQPSKAGEYFDKIQCFCFTNQTLQPGESAELPVQFYVDPAIADNPNTSDVTNITLSYTFFLAKNQKIASPRPVQPLPDYKVDTPIERNE